MMKIKFISLEARPYSELKIYDSISRIPFSIRIGDYESMPETIYSRNLDGQNFFEFSFAKFSLNLYEITMVAVQDSSVENGLLDNKNLSVDQYFSCQIDEGNSILNGSLPVKILRDKNSICINFLYSESSEIQYFAVARNYYFGIDQDSVLCSMILTDLLEEDIVRIFGF